MIIQITLSSLMAISLGIASIFIDRLLMLLSSFEKHTDQNDEYRSRIFKGSFLNFINSGVIILFINYRYKILGKVQVGKFDDVTPSWFINIGYSVVLTQIVKILSLLFWTAYQFFVPWLWRCLDRKCLCDERVTSQDTHLEYLQLYIGNEFLINYSYTEIIRTFLITFLFGSFLPVLYIISMIHLIILYFTDKILCKIANSVPPFPSINPFL